MAAIDKNPPKERTAIPLKAEPLVHPRPSCDPKPNNIPPIMARIILFLEVIFGECSTLNFNLLKSTPDINAPTITPNIWKTSHDFNGLG